MSVRALLGKKKEMSQIFTEEGVVIPVTIVEAGPCVVTQVKTEETKDGYNAVQIAFDERRAKNSTKSMVGHFKAANTTPKKRVKELRLQSAPEVELGTTLKADVFAEGDVIDVVGRSKGRGFAGGIKRHGFQSGPRSHGSKNVREPGSTGNATTPGRVWKGKRLPGHFGNKQITVRNLEIVKVDADRNLLYIRGAVPGHPNAYVFVREAISGSRRKGDKRKWNTNG